MRTISVMLPSLMLLGVALALNSTVEAPVTTESSSTVAQREQALRQEQQAINERLDRLRAAQQHLRPRGGI